MNPLETNTQIQVESVEKLLIQTKTKASTNTKVLYKLSLASKSRKNDKSDWQTIDITDMLLGDSQMLKIIELYKALNIKK